MKESVIKSAYEAAKEQYAELGIDTEKVLKQMENISLSLHCWQTDDVLGFENPEGGLSGGIAATGNYPGRARTIDEVKADLVKVTSLLPGKHRINLHAIYGDFGSKFVDRDRIEPEHFQSWIDWAKEYGLKLDFNCTLFSHAKAADGFTLSNRDKGIRDFWIEHVKRCRSISDYMGKELDTTCIHNIWAPDGSKDITVERYDYRKTLRDSLDVILEKDYEHMKDCIECKLFGLGSEAYVVGSHEFYMGYGISRNKMITLDMGHFHPTESVSDKISSLLLFSDELMFHVSRGIRWDSDHAVIFNDDLTSFAQEIVRMDALNRVHIGLDFFDASINRIGAYMTGARSTQKAFLFAMLEPVAQLRKYEDAGMYYERLALLEESKVYPWNAVWNYYCMINNVPVGMDCVADVEKYEKDILSKRN
jgi:L-rhamnose isomerase